MPTETLRPTHREETPPKRCLQCRCFMRSFHPSTVCDPCGKPVTELTSAEVWKALERSDGRWGTEAAVDALQELMVAA